MIFPALKNVCWVKCQKNSISCLLFPKEALLLDVQIMTPFCQEQRQKHGGSQASWNACQQSLQLWHWPQFTSCFLPTITGFYPQPRCNLYLTSTKQLFMPEPKPSRETFYWICANIERRDAVRLTSLSAITELQQMLELQPNGGGFVNPVYGTKGRTVVLNLFLTLGRGCMAGYSKLL